MTSTLSGIVWMVFILWIDEKSRDSLGRALVFAVVGALMYMAGFTEGRFNH